MRWQDDAACRGRGTDLFFGPEGERQAEREVREAAARAVCAGCLVRAECGEYALSRPERYGYWSGMSEDERADERRRRGRGRGRRRSGDGERGVA